MGFWLVEDSHLVYESFKLVFEVACRFQHAKILLSVGCLLSNCSGSSFLLTNFSHSNRTYSIKLPLLHSRLVVLLI